jgi:hypothetical protein
MLGGTLVVVLLGVLVNLRADGAGLPPPDARLPIQLPDGEVVPLAELIAKLGGGTRTPIQPLGVAGTPEGSTSTDAADTRARLAATLYPGIAWGPAFKLAEFHRQADRLNQALALYQSIPKGDRDYGRAQSRIAWDILTLGRGDPEAAVAHAHRALVAEPLDGNSWEDLVRIYGRTLGLALD